MKKYGLLLSCLLTFNVNKTVDVGLGTGFGWGPFKISFWQKMEIQNKILIGLVTAAITTKVAYDVSWHDTYATTVNGWYGQLKHCIQSNSIKSVDHAALHSCFSLCDRDDIIIMNRWLQDSYGSWFCPWNWTASQKKAQSRVKTVEILTMYSDLLACGDLVTGEKVVTSARNVCSCMSVYPLVDFYQMIECHIAFIKNGSLDLNDAQVQVLVQSMLPYLEIFKVTLRQEKDYIEELQTKRTHDLQEQMIAAQRASRY
jgi:hypothetical protein